MYYLFIVILEGCPYSMSVIKLLDSFKIKYKYLNEKEKKFIKEQVNIIDVSNENLLDTIEINNQVYFYENKEKGIIYDKKTNKSVGIIINGEYIID